MRIARFICSLFLAVGLLAIQAQSRAQVAVGISVQFGPPVLRFMRNPSVRDRATSGPLATGPTGRTGTFGFPAPGYIRRKSACSGLQGIGLSKTAYTPGL